MAQNGKGKMANWKFNQKCIQHRISSGIPLSISLYQNKTRQKRSITNRFQYLDKFIRKQNAQPEQRFSLAQKSLFFRQMKTFAGHNFVVLRRFHLDLFKNETHFLASPEIQIYSVRMENKWGADANWGTGRTPHNAKWQVKPAPDSRPTNIYIDTSLRLHIF